MKEKSVRLWALHHPSVAAITNEEFKVLEKGNRSRYLTAVRRLGVRPLEWKDEKEMLEQTELLAAQL